MIFSIVAVARTTQIFSTSGDKGGQELGRRKARMLYDYDAVNSDELSINAGQVSAVSGVYIVVW